MAPILFQEPDFGMSSASIPALALASGRERSPVVSRRHSKVPFHLKGALDDRKLSMSPALVRRSESILGKRIKILLISLFGIIIIVVAGGLAFRFSHRKSTPSSIPSKIWQPRPNTTLQIDLSTPITTLSVDAEVYNIDLFSNTEATIAHLHVLDRKVICYFSAGAWSPSSPDALAFKDTDLGNTLVAAEQVTAVEEGDSNERWLDTRSATARKVITARMDLAKTKGCDGVDPGHTNSYQFGSGFQLTRSTALQYVQFLYRAAESRGLSIGLRNTPALVEETTASMGWSINQGCERDFNCALYWPFVNAGKPVWHVVVVSDENDVTEQSKEDLYCIGQNTAGFQTILKKPEGGSWMERCSIPNFG